MLLSMQLYSTRNFNNYHQFIAELGRLGYDAVEGFSDLFGEADAIRASLNAAGMTMPTAHIGFDMLEGDIDATRQLCQTLGITTIYAPWLAEDERPKTQAGWSALAKRLSAIDENLAASGLNFGWHNHDFEFFPLPGGKTGMEVLLDEAPDLEWECDVAWVVRGGEEPIKWIERYAERITAAHFKDIAPAGEREDEDGWADPGTGVLNWQTIFATLKNKTRIKLLVAEHDNPSDSSRFARQAIETYRSFEQ